MKRQLELNTMLADRVLARPPVLTQNKTDQTFDDRDLVNLGAPDSNLSAGVQRQNLLRRNVMNAEVWKQQTQLMQFLNTAGVDSGSGAWQSRIDPVTGLPVFAAADDDAYQPSFIPLPSDATVAAMPLPQRPPEFVAIEHLVFEHTCMAMGVSPAMVAGVNSASATSTSLLKMSDSNLFYSILKYRNVLTTALLDVYAVVFGDTDATDVQVVFPAAQRPDTMVELFEKGYMKYEYFIMEYCRYFGLPKSAFVNEYLGPLIGGVPAALAGPPGEDSGRRALPPPPKPQRHEPGPE
jgi:hypothetical protein